MVIYPSLIQDLIRAVLVTAFLAIAPGAWAQTEVSADTSIEDQMQAFIDDGGFSARQQNGEIAVLTGVATVQALDNQPQWVAQRSLAYEQALLNAQSDYVVKQSVQITADTVSDLFKAAGREPPEFKPTDSDPSRLAEVVRKLIAVGTGHLDAALTDLKIDPAAYERASPPQRYLQMRTALTVKNTTRAFGELVGLVPVQTFEKAIGGGAYRIGVVAVVSPRMKDFAKRVLTDHGEFPPEMKSAGDVSALWADKPKLVRDFGVRWVYDRAGLPVIVSFAQWGSGYAGQDPITAQRYRDVAVKQAEAVADAQIANFLKGSINVASTTEIGQKITEAADRMPDGYVAQQAEIRELMDSRQDTIRRQAQIALTGLTTAARWSEKHPDNGQPIVGVVRIWSAAGEQATRRLRDGRPPTIAAGSSPSGPGAGQGGRKLMDASDF